MTDAYDHVTLVPNQGWDPRVLVDKGVLDFIPNTYGVTKGYSVRENVATPYAMASLKGHFGTAELTGNLGVQAVHHLREHHVQLPLRGAALRVPVDALELDERHPVGRDAGVVPLRPRLCGVPRAVDDADDTAHRGPPHAQGARGSGRPA